MTHWETSTTAQGQRAAPFQHASYWGSIFRLLFQKLN